MISFELSEEQGLVQQTARQFAERELRPQLRKSEAAGGLSDAVLRKAHDLGLQTLCVPAELGGGGQSLTTQAIVNEELGWADAAAPFALGGPGAFGAMLLELGDAEQTKRWLSPFGAPGAHAMRGAVAWSESRPNERAGFRTTAKKSGNDWLLEGQKAYAIGGGVADVHLVFAQIEPERGWDGIGAFVVERGNAGLKAGARQRPVGLDAVHFGEVILEACRVPDRARLAGGGDFFAALGRGFSRLSVVTAAAAVGLGRAAWEIARDYCETRRAFGKPIGHFQAIAFTMADRLMDVESARWLLWRACAQWDAGRYDARAVAVAAAQAQEAAMRSADDAVQLHGGMGFMRDLPVEKMMRDAKTLALVGMSTAALDQVTAMADLKVARDVEATLPTPDIQPVFT